MGIVYTTIKIGNPLKKKEFIDMQAKVDTGATPLHFAAHRGHKDVAELLIFKGANVNAQTTGGFTPLYWASYRGHKDIMELLTKHGGHK